VKAARRWRNASAFPRLRAQAGLDRADSAALTVAADAVSDLAAPVRRRGILLELLRYIVVGGLAFVVDWSILRLGLHLGAHYLVATALGFAAGLALNYALCVAWVWRGTSATAWRDFAVFALIGLGGLLLTGGLMRLAVESGGLSAPVAKLPVAGIVLLWNFGLRRLFVFFH
jgi:putative flippase GtrA